MSNEMTAEQYRKMIGGLDAKLARLEASYPRHEADSVTITVPGLPAYVLSPNSRVHWARKAGASLDAKNRGYLACRGLTSVSGPVAITWTVYLGPRRKPMDIDNMLTCLKPVQDSFVLAGIIDGDGPDIVTGFTLVQRIHSEHKSPPRIVAVIRKVMG